ncbi:MAG: hypothetical protein ACRCXA_02350, partial [Peptostreptococcaceae bacterium]
FESTMNFESLMEVYPPLDFTNKRLRALAKALSPAYMRVSGSWASATYYDFEGKTKGKAPEGFKTVMTKEQWTSALEFAKAVGAKVMVSLANTEGAHNPDGSWNSEQAKLLWDYSKEFGVPISAAEYMNEPNVLQQGGAPKGYTPADFGRDQDLFFRFIRENHPETILVGPSACADGLGKGTTLSLNVFSTKELLDNCKEMPDAFSYHFYYGLSERLAILGNHWNPDDVMSENYLSSTDLAINYYSNIRDEYAPKAPLWVTEAADAGGGGNTWSSTFLDTVRYVDQLGRFSKNAQGIVFHNTLTASDYGLLDSHSHYPRPNYWAALLWANLVGTLVYDTHEVIREGAHIYAQSRKDGKEGYVYIIVNNSKTDNTYIEISSKAERYTLSAPHLRSQDVLLNGELLELRGECALPPLNPIIETEGTINIDPATVTFLVV